MNFASPKAFYLNVDLFLLSIDVNSTSTVYRVLFQTIDRQDRVICSSLILKLASDDKSERFHLNIRKIFLREIYIYDEVGRRLQPENKQNSLKKKTLNLPFQIFSCMRQFEHSSGVDEEKGFCEYPKYFKKISTEEVECIFLEDVSNNGFIELNQATQAVTVQHILLVMKVLGKFHASTLALKEQKQRIFNGMIGEFNEINEKDRTTKWAKMLSSTPSFVIDAMAASPDTYVLNKILRFYERSQFDIVMECIDANVAEPFAVITHGDCWTKNTRFQYNERNLPVKTCLIDWKLSKYCSPVCDVVQFLFCSTTKQQRAAYYDTFLKAYYESLSHQLTAYGNSLVGL